jgi:hypothetical protein
MSQVVVGIDFSLSCPCICHWTFDNAPFALSGCQFHYLIAKKKFERFSGQFIGHPHEVWKSNEERYDKITNWAMTHVPLNSKVFLEGFSFGSRLGMLFNIAELTGLLKHKLYKANIEVTLVPPTTLKKFACGAGNARKEVLYESFYKETNFDLLKELNIKVAGTNPSSDIVDSYYLAKYGYQKVFV